MIIKFFTYVIIVLAVLALKVTLFINFAPQFGSNPTSKQMEFYQNFSNYKENQFKGLQPTPMMTGEVSTLDYFKTDSNRTPSRDVTPTKINYSSFSNVEKNNYKIAWLGHSAFIINLGGKKILLDPMLGSHASPLPIPSLRRYNKILPIDPLEMTNIDFVVLSHDHYDHLDYSTIKKIKENVKTFLVPHGLGNHLIKWNVKKEKIIELNWDENYQFGEIEFVCLPSRHFSGRGPLNRNYTLWSSWAIKSPGAKIYFSGDSGYGDHFKKIGKNHGPFDISLLDCGQYNLAWKYVHMFPFEAILAAKELRTKYFMPIHWGGFTLALHPWDEPVIESIKLAEESGLSYITPGIGEVLSKNTINKPYLKWWEEY